MTPRNSEFFVTTIIIIFIIIEVCLSVDDRRRLKADCISLVSLSLSLSSSFFFFLLILRCPSLCSHSCFLVKLKVPGVCHAWNNLDFLRRKTDTTLLCRRHKEKKKSRREEGRSKKDRLTWDDSRSSKVTQGIDKRDGKEEEQASWSQWVCRSGIDSSLVVEASVETILLFKEERRQLKEEPREIKGTSNMLLLLLLLFLPTSHSQDRQTGQ